LPPHGHDRVGTVTQVPRLTAQLKHALSLTLVYKAGNRFGKSAWVEQVYRLPAVHHPRKSFPS
jgi:hypothetical protein